MAQTAAAASARPLQTREIRALRARAHGLKPVVRIGHAGLTAAVCQELDRALNAHELVKIHAAVDDRDQRTRILDELCRQLGAPPVQSLGKMLVAFRARPEPAPAASEATATRQARRAGGERRSAAKRPAKRPRRPPRRT